MLEMHFTQPGFTYCACRPFAKNREEIQKFKETGDSRKSYQEQDMACSQHDIASGDLKDLPWSKIASDKSK